MLTWIKRRLVEGAEFRKIYWVADLGKLRFLIDDFAILTVQEKGEYCWKSKKSVICKDVNSAKEKAEKIFEEMMTVYEEDVK